MPRKEFESFTRLDASDVNTYLMDQTVMTFAGTAARGSAIGTATEGMYTHLNDTDTLQYWDGSDWVNRIPAEPGEWVSFTPTWTGLTVGNGVYARAAYSLVGKTVNLTIRFTLGSTSAITGAVTVSVPSIIERKTINAHVLSSVFLLQTGAANFLGSSLSDVSDASKFRILSAVSGATGAGVGIADISATVPFTWANTHIMAVNLSYEVA
jgi:hypothetical protein